MWVPDQGDGTYRNPILFADYSDPDVIRVGDDFWLTSSSFHCTPGLPILHSKDLVNWTIVNHALKNVPGEQYRQVRHNCGVWAPAIRFHQGKYWIFFPTPDEGIYVTTATDPRGQWSPPHLMAAGKGLIDPCPLWDDDGQAYLVHAYAGSRAGIKNRLRVAPMATDGSKLIGEGKIVFHEPEKHPTLEGPKFLKKDGWYYILAPAGGVSKGWQVVLRSREIYGPYEDKIVLAQGSTPINGPHQGALVDLPNGEWWFVHFQERQPYGRVVHLQPVQWHDGWPLMGINQNEQGVGEPVLRYRKPKVDGQHPIATPQTSDEFDAPKLGLQWQWQANHEDDWHSLSARQGWLRLPARRIEDTDLYNAPNLLLQKLPAESFVAETMLQARLNPGELAGLTVMGRQYAVLALRQSGDRREIVYIVNGTDEWVQPYRDDVVRLRMELASGGKCSFSYAPVGQGFRAIERQFQASDDGWIGAKVGIFCVATGGEARGHGDFDYFRITAP
ncbi:glycoside hydrolase family 43 protein [Fontivita pretiosa]|uniref:glycoside hydrolase family 43 protein n=1 Tax=Fontivita pretiosa TaxID=2989684 RepID=UPI003D16D813